jgi:hypothetical protein
MRCTVVAKGCAFFAQRLALALSTSKKCFTKISGQSKSTNRSPQRLLTALPGSNFGILAPEHQGYDQPRILTAAIIPKTAGTPNLPFKIGRTNTPNGSPDIRCCHEELLGSFGRRT